MSRYEIRRGPVADWDALHALLRTCFAFMEGRIDPPSSLASMTPGSLRAKAAEETLANGRVPVVYTSRQLISTDREASLLVGQQVAAALVELIRRLRIARQGPHASLGSATQRFPSQQARPGVEVQDSVMSLHGYGGEYAVAHCAPV